MMTYYTLISTVLTICLLLVLVDTWSKLAHSEHKTISVILILATIFYVLLDLIWVQLYMAEDYNRPLLAITSVLFYLIYITLPYIWFLFAHHFASNINKNRKWMIISAIPWFINLFLVILTALGTNVLWAVGDSANRYVRGPLFGVFSNLNLLYYFIPVVEILLIMIRKPKNISPMLLRTFGFSVIPALSVFIHTYIIPVEAVIPFQPSCFFIGVMFAYTLLITTAYKETEEQNARLTERALAAERIAELSESVSALLTNMPAMTFSKDVKTGRYLACNQPFADYAHKETPEEVAGLTDAEIFDPVTAAHFVEDDQLALSMDEPYVFYEDVLDGAGNPRQFQTTKIKFVDPDGRLCLLGMCADVTDIVSIRRGEATTKEAYEKARRNGIIYTHIAQTLSHGYTDLFYVDIESGEFIEYQNLDEDGNLTEVRHERDFFESCKRDAKELIHPEDRDIFVKAMDRDTLLEALHRNDAFVMTYRRLVNGKPIYVNMRVSSMKDDDRYIVIGVTDVDEQMRQRRLEERMKEERIIYSRLQALTGNFICVYVMDPETDRYREFSENSEYVERYAQAKEGTDFFTDFRKTALLSTHPDDLNRLLSVFTRENVMAEVEQSGIFTLSYRLVMDDKPVHVQVKAAMVEETAGRRLIVGINDVDAQVRQEEEYGKRLAKAQNEASIDALTGVKNKHAYLEMETHMDLLITEHRQAPFAIVMLDINDLKIINDTAGHQAGDQYIRDACKIACDIFEHSPIYRVGGDEFVVIAQGDDYADIEKLTEKVSLHNEEASRSGGIVIACGMARYEDDLCVATVFERADQRMYENKNDLKS